MVRKLNFLIVAIATICVGCSTEKRNERSDITRSTLDTLLITLPLNVSASLIRPHLFTLDTDELIVAYDYLDHSISILNLSKRAYSKKINLVKDRPDFIESVGAMAVLDQGSIIIASMNYLTIMNFDGKVLEMFSINTSRNDLEGFDFLKFELDYSQYSGLQYDSKRGSILMQISSMVRSKPQEYEGSRIAEVGLREKNIRQLEVRIPKVYVPDIG